MDKPQRLPEEAIIKNIIIGDDYMKPVNGFEEYYTIDKNGIVYSLKTKKPLDISKDVPTKPCYRFYDKKRYYVENLLIENGYYNVKKDEFIYYLDSNPFNTSVENIRVLNKNKDKIKLVEQLTGNTVAQINEFYFISNTGNLYSYFNQKIKLIKPYLRHDGYYEHYYQENGVRHVRKTHRLVAEYFVPKPKGCDIVNHIDGNKINNSYDNLEWTTSFWNNEHAKQNGLNTGTFGEAKKACLVGRNNEILLVCDSIAQLAEKIGKDSSTASKQTRGLKNKYADGTKVRLYSTENNNFVPTKYD